MILWFVDARFERALENLGDDMAEELPIQIGWDNAQQTVVRLTLRDNWSWEELYTSNQEIIKLMNSTPQTVHLLIDYTQTNAVPVGGVIMHARNILTAYPPNCDLLIMVTRNMLVQRLTTIFQATFQNGIGKRVYSVTSDDAAYRLIEKRTRPQTESN